MKLVSGVLVACLLSFPVKAQLACDQSREVEKNLYLYKEAPMLALVSDNGTLVRIWRDAEREQWSMTSTQPGTGVTCLLAIGTGVTNIVWHVKKVSNDL